jgi:antitoxin component YwqK of YwqJK toxin-antitoxin module
MKLNRTLVAILAIVLLAVCSKSINSQQLQDREGLVYEVNDAEPYTGKLVVFHENGQKREERNYVDGKAQGKQEEWYEDGQKWSEKNYLNGKEHGSYERWYENGQKMLEEHYIDGQPHGKRIVWAENGKILAEVNYVDGVLVERKNGY